MYRRLVFFDATVWMALGSELLQEKDLAGCDISVSGYRIPRHGKTINAGLAIGRVKDGDVLVSPIGQLLSSNGREHRRRGHLYSRGFAV